MCACMHIQLLQSCPTLWDPVDDSPLASSVNGILQARILEWVLLALLQNIFLTQGWNQVSCISCNAGRFFLQLSHQRSPIRTSSDDHYIYYSGQESLQRNGVALIVNKSVWNAVLWCNLKNERMVSACFQGKPFNITVIHVYAPITNSKEAEVEWFCEDFTRPSRTSTK